MQGLPRPQHRPPRSQWSQQVAAQIVGLSVFTVTVGLQARDRVVPQTCSAANPLPTADGVRVSEFLYSGDRKGGVGAGP